MEIERNVLNNNNIFSMIRRESEKIETENGEVKFVISNEMLEEMEYQMYLINSIAERERTFTDEKTLTIDEFEKRLGL